MHELAITKSIADIVINKQEEMGATRVLRVWIDAGEMRNLEPSWVQRYFDRCTEGTSAEGAQIVVNRIPIIFECQDCGQRFRFELHHEGRTECPNCAGQHYELISGRELSITNLEVA